MQWEEMAKGETCILCHGFLSSYTDTLITVHCALKQETLGLYTLALWRNHLHVCTSSLNYLMNVATLYKGT